MSKIRTMIVDDSAIVRRLLGEALADAPDIEVVATAPDPFVARDRILELKPDVLTLDIEMPRMDGLTFLRKLMHYRPMPVIVISSLGTAGCQTALEALRLGAVEVLAKPGGPYSVGELRNDLAARIRAAAAARLPAQRSQPAVPPPPGAAFSADPSAILAIGASTGGTQAIEEVLLRMPANCPATVITQHIPPVFSLAFANRLNSICPMEVREAQDGDVVAPGRVLIAPGNFHMLLRRSPAGCRVSVQDGPRVCYQRPSVDVMFSSVADAAAAHTIGVLLTGMGSDGAKGLLRLKQAGALTIAQDKASSVVFGMPREAIRLGAADQVLPLDRIADGIITRLAHRRAA